MLYIGIQVVINISYYRLQGRNMKLAYYIVFYRKNIKGNKTKIAELSSKTRDTTVTTFFGSLEVMQQSCNY
jgi:hypothetical protein